MEGPNLAIELIPSSSFGKNLRKALTSTTWDTIRKKVYERANNRCEICGGQGSRHPVECHEIWDYDDESRMQRLLKFEALCPECHLVKHIGRASAIGLWEEAVDHLAKVNDWPREDAEDYANRQLATWARRSQYQWNVDCSLLLNSPFTDWIEGRRIMKMEEQLARLDKIKRRGVVITIK